MTKDEALDLALEALELSSVTVDSFGVQRKTQEAITAIKQARSAPVQDSTCNETLRAQGKAYPRTCRKCGLGPCIGAPKQPPATQRQWVGLTKTVVGNHLRRHSLGDQSIFRQGFKEGVAFAEAKLREKNGGKA